MAPEVIDLVSESDDDTPPNKKATATLASFQPRKQKTIAYNVPTRPQQLSQQPPQQQSSDQYLPNGKRRPAPLTHDVGKRYTQQPEPWQLVQQSNGSLADLLRQQQQVGMIPQGPVGINGGSTQAKTLTAKRPTVAKRTGGSVREERMKKSKEFYMKEALRKTEATVKNKQVKKTTPGVKSPEVGLRNDGNTGISGSSRSPGQPVVPVAEASRQRTPEETDSKFVGTGHAHLSTSAADREVNGVRAAAGPVLSAKTLKTQSVGPLRAVSPDSDSSEDVPDVVPAGVPKRKPATVRSSLQPPVKRLKESSDLVSHSAIPSPKRPLLVEFEVPSLGAPGTPPVHNHLLEFANGHYNQKDSASRSPADSYHTLQSQIEDQELPDAPLQDSPDPPPSLAPKAPPLPGPKGRWSEEEDALLFKLRDDGLTWDDVAKYFTGRTKGALQVRLSVENSRRKGLAKASTKIRAPIPVPLRPQRDPDATKTPALPKRKARNGARQSDYVSWTEIRNNALGNEDHDMSDAPPVVAPSVERYAQVPASGSAARDSANPGSLERILRARELGRSTARGHSAPHRHVSDELQNHFLDTLGPRRFFHGTSRDVNCVAFAPNGNSFAAGSICISDETSMQYNRPYNLLLGDIERNSLTELPEHHVLRPRVTDSKNVNSLHSMQETQDPRLFKTVAAVTFSPDGTKLYSAGGDNMVRMYDASSAQCLSSFNQGSTVDLLSMHQEGFLATAGHRSDARGITILGNASDTFSEQHHLGPNQSEAHASVPIFPSALKWGVAPQHSAYLLAGFSSDTLDDFNNYTGQACLWDLKHDVRMPMAGTERNVFDIAWNPFPSSASSVFAVASAKSGRRVRSLIQCFAPNQGKAKRVLEWDCPALDINDVIYCPHDDNLIAAGATDGKVYIWDKRYADRNQSPLHVLAHGATKNVLDHDRELEAADTGVRFLSWSATGNRLYSGSSDGTVKVWNPYRTTQDALVKNVAHFNSAVMCGAFSPDYRDLLIGEDQGQLNLLGIDRDGRSVRAAKRFDLYPAETPALPPVDGIAASRDLVSSGQVKIRPMGAHVKQQAVQGPAWGGPYLIPPEDLIDALYNEMELAQSELDTIQRKIPSPGESEADLQSAEQSANHRLDQARKECGAVRARKDEAIKSETKALMLQQHFRERREEAKHNALTYAMGRCSLDCGYFPTLGEADGQAPDNHMSEQRIPERLPFSGVVVDTSDYTNAEIDEAGLTSKCRSCMGPAAVPKRGLPKCQRCSLKHSGLTARCAQCSAPVHSDLDNLQKRTICQRCGFHCLRCGLPATTSSNGRNIRCDACEVRWEAGALGYYANTWNPKRQDVRSQFKTTKDLGKESDSELGADEIQRLASGWEVPLIDHL